LDECCNLLVGKAGAVLLQGTSPAIFFDIKQESMKLVKSIIRQEKLTEVVEELSRIVPGMTVSEVRGHGRQKGHQIIYRGLEYTVTLLPKVMVEIAIDDNKVDDVVRVLSEAAKTGEIGDGRIFVLPIETAYHVRTGFMDLA
jgi:nitrogen regulatory protein PII